MKNFKKQNGAISVIVLVTMLLMIAILSGTYMINANVRKAQIKSQIQLRDEYAATLEEKNDIYNDIWCNFSFN